VKKLGITFSILALALALFIYLGIKETTAAGKGDWTFKATIIEGCSCRLMCPCFFNTTPDKHYCQFNNALKVTSGHYGSVKLAGVKVWLSGDLGEDFGDGTGGWLVYTFDPATTQEQIDAMTKILPTIYPLKFEVLGIDKKPISWEAKSDKAIAKIGDGMDGMLELTPFKNNAGKTSVIQNLTYMGAKSNNGFMLHRSKHHYKGHDKEYSFENTNGFLIEISSSGSI